MRQMQENVSGNVQNTYQYNCVYVEQYLRHFRCGLFTVQEIVAHAGEHFEQFMNFRHFHIEQILCGQCARIWFVPLLQCDLDGFVDERRISIVDALQRDRCDNFLIQIG